MNTFRITQSIVTLGFAAMVTTGCGSGLEGPRIIGVYNEQPPVNMQSDNPCSPTYKLMLDKETKYRPGMQNSESLRYTVSIDKSCSQSVVPDEECFVFNGALSPTGDPNYLTFEARDLSRDPNDNIVASGTLVKPATANSCANVMLRPGVERMITVTINTLPKPYLNTYVALDLTTPGGTIITSGPRYTVVDIQLR